MTTLRKLVPRPLKRVAAELRKMVTYTNYDSSAYWRKRAAEPGQAAVLWKNQDYNRLYRQDQRQIIKPWIDNVPAGGRVLDIGCGIGVVASMMRSMRADIAIDAVDFAEMVEIARAETAGQDINYIASGAEDYSGNGIQYDVIVSSGCYSAIRDIEKLRRSLDLGADMLAPGGTMLLIDPFHRWNYLARAKFGSQDVIDHLSRKGLDLVHKSGVLFWPYRLKLANSQLTGIELEQQYRDGEKLLKQLGPHFWADYKILSLRKKV